MAKKTWSIQVMFEDFESRKEWEDSLPYENTGGEMETLFFEGMFASKKEAEDAAEEIKAVLEGEGVDYQDISVNSD